jgi:hypothetical protein
MGEIAYDLLGNGRVSSSYKNVEDSNSYTRRNSGILDVKYSGVLQYQHNVSSISWKRRATMMSYHNFRAGQNSDGHPVITTAVPSYFQRMTSTSVIRLLCLSGV